MLLAVATWLSLTGAAHALSGTRVLVGTPTHNGPPSIAVDAAGTAYIAWADTASIPYVVNYCVIPAGAHACTVTGTLAPADGLQYIDRVHVVVDGSTVVIFADVYGNTAGYQNYEPLQEWHAADGSGTFTPVAGGKSVADGLRSADTEPVGGVVVPGSPSEDNVLGFGWDTAAGPPSFQAFPLNSPPECSRATAPQCPYATLEPAGNPDQIGNQPAAIASQTGAYPGVLAVYFADFTTGPFGCSNAQTVPFSMVYAYGSGGQSATNDYNISPGLPNSAWRFPVTLGDCNVEYLAVAGGPSGFGVLEQDELHGTTVYHVFDQATNTFGVRYLVSTAKEQSPSLSQDAAGGLYATYLENGGGTPIVLSSSQDGGVLWRGPTTLDANTDQKAANVTSAVGPAGQGWAAWADGGSIYAQQFVAGDSSPPPTSVRTFQFVAGTPGSSNAAFPEGTTGIQDNAVVDGRNGPNASGTMSFVLYSKAGCAPTSAAFHSTVAMPGNGADSAPVGAVLKPGTYYWIASYSGDAYNAGSSSHCGDEKLTITPAAKIGKTATSTAKTVTVSVGCATVPCPVAITITVPGSGGKAITLATGTTTLRTAGQHKVKLRLTRPGTALRKHHRGRLKAKIRLREKLHGHRLTTTGKLSIKPVR